LLKTNAQKKWAVKTRPFGREGRIVTPPAPGCKRQPAEMAGNFNFRVAEKPIQTGGWARSEYPAIRPLNGLPAYPGVSSDRTAAPRIAMFISITVHAIL
jgi:hypothetical protein